MSDEQKEAMSEESIRKCVNQWFEEEYVMTDGKLK